MYQHFWQTVRDRMVSSLQSQDSTREADVEQVITLRCDGCSDGVGGLPTFACTQVVFTTVSGSPKCQPTATCLAT